MQKIGSITNNNEIFERIQNRWAFFENNKTFFTDKTESSNNNFLIVNYQL